MSLLALLVCFCGHDQRVLVKGLIDLFGLETCNRERDAIVVLACAYDIAGRVVIFWFKAKAFVHQIEKAVKANAGPPKRV